jgi:hypothetical protein
MGKLIAVASLIAIIAVASFLYWLSPWAMGGLKSGFSWSEMDWDQNGSTSASELIDAIDIDTRVVEENGQQCLEYFALKDGMPVKVTCPVPERYLSL